MQNNFSQQHYLAEELAKQTRMIQMMQIQIEEMNKKVKGVYNVVLALIIVIFFVPFIFGLIGGFLSAL